MSSIDLEDLVVGMEVTVIVGDGAALGTILLKESDIELAKKNKVTFYHTEIEQRKAYRISESQT